MIAMFDICTQPNCLIALIFETILVDTIYIFNESKMFIQLIFDKYLHLCTCKSLVVICNNFYDEGRINVSEPPTIPLD